jgi:Tfp pilus assembly protein PilF
LAIFYNNRGVCFTKLKKNKDAKKEFTMAIQIKPDYVKPRALRMKIAKEDEEYDLALEDAKKIQELEP